MIKNFFYPGSVCVAGASSKPGSIGYELLHTIKQYNFTGAVYAVNPKAADILGYACYAAVRDIPHTLDLAFVVVPKQFVEETIDELLEKEVKAIVLITAGFRETGAEGAEKERLLVEKVKAKGARLVGPNCMGVVNSFRDIHLNATFVAESPIQSGTGFLSQSGALGAAVINSLRETGITFGHFISVGNKADINENDILEFWLQDDRIKTVAMYLESFVDGQKLLSLVRNSKKEKPVVILKGGKKEGAIRAAASHTGALAASDVVVDALFKQEGIIRAQSTNEMFSTLQAFEQFPLPAGNRIAVLTNAGGPAILAVDALEEKGLQLALLSEETKTALRAIVHPEGSVQNPVDLLPGGTAEQFAQCAKLLLADENTDVVLSLFVEPVMVKPLPVVTGLEAIGSTKPLYQVILPLPEFWDEYKAKGSGKLLFRRVEDPAAVIAHLLFYSRKKNNALPVNITQKQFPTPLGKNWLSAEMTDKLLRHYAIPVPDGAIVKVYELGERSKEFTYPAVLKGLADEVTHKSEFNFVKMNIETPEELVEAAIEMLDTAIKKKVRLPKFLIQPQVSARHEILLGGFRDPSFGPVLMFGSGGKYVEVLADRAIRSADASEEEIASMIQETKIGKILYGVRGERPTKIPEIIQILKSVAAMLIANPSIAELDLNPLILTTDKKLFCVDARIRCT